MMIIITAFLSVIIGGVSVFFALQNAEAVTVSFLAWHASVPLADVLFITLLIGVLATFALGLPTAIRTDRRMRALLNEKEKLQEELAKYQITIPIAPPGITLDTLSNATMMHV